MNTETKSNEQTKSDTDASSEGSKNQEFQTTIAHLLGEIIWLFNQSPSHRHFSIADLDWVLAPALAEGQYRVFRDGDKPVGVAIWAFVDEATDKKLTDNKERIRPDEWKKGDILWLVELVSPFSDEENKLSEKMFADLVNGPFKGKSFRFSRVDAESGKREVAEFKPKT